MNFFTLSAILAVIIGLSSSVPFDSVVESINKARIVGGKTARPGQFPYVVSLRYQAKVNGTVGWFAYQCGGSIISKRWILTAAHCTQRYFSNSSNVAIAVSAHHIQNDGQIYRLNRIVNHPSFSEGKNDLSLLQTVKGIQFTSAVQPISLRKQFVGADVAATVSGWGQIRLKGADTSPTNLQYLSVNTLTNDDCHNRHTAEYQRNINNGTICAFARRGQGACFGDSGNPLASHKQLIGVLSWGKPCAVGVPDGYMRVSEFVEWIQEVSGVVAE